MVPIQHLIDLGCLLFLALHALQSFFRLLQPQPLPYPLLMLVTKLSLIVEVQTRLEEDLLIIQRFLCYPSVTRADSTEHESQLFVLFLHVLQQVIGLARPPMSQSNFNAASLLKDLQVLEVWSVMVV